MRARTRTLGRRLGAALGLWLACAGCDPDQHGGPDAGAGGAGGVSAGSCANLACLQRAEGLMLGCAAAGACVEQTDATMQPVTAATCFDNGVKVLSTETTSLGASFTSTSTYDVRNREGPCYRRTFVTLASLNADTGFALDITTVDPSGVDVAAVHIDADDVATVTCPGGPPTVFAASCGFSESSLRNPFLVPGTAGEPTCDEGACSL